MLSNDKRLPSNFKISEYVWLILMILMGLSNSFILLLLNRSFKRLVTCRAYYFICFFKFFNLLIQKTVLLKKFVEFFIDIFVNKFSFLDIYLCSWEVQIFFFFFVNHLKTVSVMPLFNPFIFFDLASELIQFYFRIKICL